MLDLIEIGISENIIDEMINYNGVTKVGLLNAEYKNTYKIISALEEIRIDDTTINLLLINMIDLFFIDYDKFINILKNNDIKDISERINIDFTEAYDIFLAN